jgi:hypothetical protein
MIMRYCLFCTPSYTHTVSLEYFKMTLELWPLLSKANIASGFSVIGGDQFIAKARNLLVASFLAKPELTDLFFLDDDVSAPAEKIVKFIQRPEDVIIGCYPKKQDKLDFPVELVGNSETGELIERDGLVQIIAGPTGFMRIRRHVIEKLALHAGTFMDVDSEDNERVSPNIFRTGVASIDGAPNRFVGEDWQFCLDVQAAGFEIWCDPDIDFTHRGNKVYRDNLSLHLDVYREKGLAAAKILSEKVAQAKADAEVEARAAE